MRLDVPLILCMYLTCKCGYFTTRIRLLSNIMLTFHNLLVPNHFFSGADTDSLHIEFWSLSTGLYFCPMSVLAYTTS